MAVKNSSLGLKLLELADVPATGLPTTWEVLEDVKIGTANLTEEEDTTEDIEIEESDDTYRTIKTKKGAIKLTFELYDVSPQNLKKLKGGTVTDATATAGDIWSPDENSIDIYRAARVTTKDGYKLVFANGFVKARITWNLTKSELATVTVEITANKPIDPTLKIFTVEHPEKA
ncbi:Uncharacterised protein [Sphingobacterium multivorum]|uniref:hypothetical protein n=1 Tax=Sphingobacterium multivorum TaxID=28454 RepID=UPI000E0660B5|nr:hypothetical protein [Sphingobacterium multivorum]QQT43352.1 hypothetical protein I6J00_16530 [Sphingobacterium multivorum]SUI98470.1 Uncharacterised protein [Sphingobacterium multivorum]